MTSHEKPHLSASQLLMAGRCMEQYRRRYIEGHKISPGIAMSIGRATHRSIEYNMKSKLSTGELLPLEEAKEIARDTFVSICDTEEIRLDDDEKAKGLQAVKGEAIDWAVRLAETHYRGLAPTIAPIHVERPWRIEIKDYPYDLIGYIDIQDSDTIIDTKTVSKAPAASSAETDDQLTLYAMAAHVLDNRIPSLRKDFLVKSTTPKIIQQMTERSVDDFNPILFRIEALSLCIEKGIFPPTNQDNWWCSTRFCGYAMTCKYFRRRK